MTAAIGAMAAPVSGRAWGDVDGVAVDRQVHVHTERAAHLLGKLTEQASGPGQQREPAQQFRWQAEVGEGGAAGPCPVERQRTAEHLWVDPADRLEQAQVRAKDALLRRDLEQRPGTR